jgi:outer membrane protein TolC
MTVSRTLSLVLGFVAAALSVAQSSRAELLTADRAVQIALQKSPQVVNAGASVLEARSGLYSSYSGILPHLSANVSRSGDWTDHESGSQVFGGRLISSGTFSSETFRTTPGLSASWSVLDLSAFTGLSAARQGLKAAKLSQTATRNDAALAVRRQFFAVVGAIHLAGVNAEALRLSRDNERRVRALYEVGSVSKSDVLKAQVQTAQSQLDSLTSANQITIQRIALASQLGIAEAAMGEVDTTLTFGSTVYDEAAILAEATQHRPDLLAAAAQLKSARSARWSSRLTRLPYLTLSGNAAFNLRSNSKTTEFNFTPPDTATASLLTTDATYGAAIALNWDFFDGLTADSRNASAQARLVRAQENYDALQRNLAAEVRQALLSYREALESVDVAERAVESATENLKLTQQKYNVGSSTILDLIDAQVQLQRAENQRVVARAGVRVADAAIRRVSGRND